MFDAAALSAENQRMRERLTELEVRAARPPDDRLRIVLETANVGVATTDAHGNVTSFNEAFRALVGYDADELASKRFSDFTHPEDLAREQVYFDEILAGTRDRYHIEKRYLARDGRHVWVDIYVGATRAPDGTVEQYVGVVADISARRHAEALLREREALLSAVFAHMTEAVVLLALTPGASPRIVTANRAAGELIAPGSLPGSNGAIGAPFPEALTKLMPMPAERVAGFVARVEATAHATGPTTFMDVLPTRAGPRQFESSIVPVRGPDGVVSHVLWTGRDVTEKTRQEEALRASLEEKETLMREIHHRVKNNFQLVSSLLSLQERADGDARLAEAFERARARIRAMSSVHERLYGSSSVSHLDFGAHLRELVEALAPAASGARVSCETDDGVTVDIETAIPLGLISAELVTNALKHAYPAGAPGPIEVRLLLAGDRLVLSVADQGAGLPADFTPDASRSLGVRLVESLSRQLDAEVTWTRENGTRVTVSLPRRARASET